MANIDRRRSPRTSIDVLVHLDGFSEGAPDDASLANGVNISEDGMLVEAKEADEAAAAAVKTIEWPVK